jgi:hypothetical protein
MMPKASGKVGKFHYKIPVSCHILLLAAQFYQLLAEMSGITTKYPS